MTREQFNRLLRNPSTIDLNFISDLEEITRRFPYFANAHILLAKQYHGHENIKYESHLRKASAYAPDRTLLYQLIKQEPGEVIHISSPSQTNEPNAPKVIPAAIETPVTDNFNLAVASVKVAENTDSSGAESDSNVAPAEPSDDVILSGSEVSEHDSAEQTPARSLSPLEIVERRLRELEGKDKQEKAGLSTAESSIPAGNTVSSEISPDISNSPEEKEIKEPETVAQSPADKMERDDFQIAGTENIPAIPKETTSRSEPKQPRPEITSAPDRSDTTKESAKPRTIQDIPITHSFSDWLKIKSIPVIAAENIGAYLLTGNDQDKINQPIDYQPDLIEKFIKSEPRIVPGKSEFYSPGNMARRSAIEHEDLISETLARIYAQQGNISKAIDAYQRLSLKNPEKSTYFAALIKELEERLEE